MPDLIYKGNTINNFGRFLPSPYIERIYVNDNSVEVVLSLLFNSATDFDIEEYIEVLRMKDLKIYFLFSPEIIAGEVLTSTYDLETGISIESKNIATALDIIDGKRNVFEGFHQWTSDTTMATSSGTWEPGDRKLFQQFSLNDVELLSDVATDAKGFTIAKMRATLEFPDSTTNMFNPVYYWGDRSAGSSNGDLYLFSFVSLLDYSEVVDLDGMSSESAGVSDTYGNNLLISLPNIEAQLSNVAYIKLFQNGGDTAYPTQINYFDQSGTIYYETPFRNIDSYYYKADNLTRKDIIQTIRSLVDAHSENPGKNLNDVLTNILYIVNEYGDSVELLIKLNQYKIAYPYKRRPGPAGKFFKIYRRIVNKIIKALTKEGRLIKRINKNPKVVDQRGLLGLPYVPPELPEWAVEGYVEEGSAFVYNYRNIGREIYSAVDYDVTDDEGGTMESHIRNFGYYYFDYEKAAGIISTLARVFSYQKVKSFFGDEVINEHFKLTDTSLHRTIEWKNEFVEGYVAPINKMDAVVTYEKGYPQVEKIEQEAQTITFPGWTTPGLQVDSGYITETVYGTESAFGTAKNYSYILLRNFKFVDETEDTLGDYKLMAFEYQDFYNKNTAVLEEGIAGISVSPEVELGASEEYYITTVKVEDSTAEIAQAIMDSFFLSKDEIERYIELAEQKCSADEIDGSFNDFFVESMATIFPPDSGLAPWLVAPFLYHLHLDLITNRYSGEMDVIKEYAKMDSAKIDPLNGNLQNLRSFRDRYEALYNDYYSEFALAIPGTPINALRDLAPLAWTFDTGGGSVPYLAIEREFSTKHNISNITPLDVTSYATVSVSEETVDIYAGTTRYDRIYKILERSTYRASAGGTADSVSTMTFQEYFAGDVGPYAVDASDERYTYIGRRTHHPTDTGASGYLPEYWSTMPTTTGDAEVLESQVQKWIVDEVYNALLIIRNALAGLSTSGSTTEGGGSSGGYGGEYEGYPHIAEDMDASMILWWTMMRNWILWFDKWSNAKSYARATFFSIVGTEPVDPYDYLSPHSRWYYSGKALMQAGIIGLTSTEYFPPGDMVSDASYRHELCDDDSAVTGKWGTVVFLWNGMSRWFATYGREYETDAIQALEWIGRICYYNIASSSGPRWDGLEDALREKDAAAGYKLFIDVPTSSSSGAPLEMTESTNGATWRMGGCEDDKSFVYYCQFNKGNEVHHSEG